MSFAERESDSAAPLSRPGLLRQSAGYLTQQLYARPPETCSPDNEVSAATLASFTSGSLGEAFLAAAMVRVGFGDLDIARQRCTEALQPILRLGESACSGLELGSFRGVGALVYGLTCVGHWLDEPPLLAQAARFARRIDQDSIDRDCSFEVYAGAAGALLSLLALEETLAERGGRAADREWILRRAERCGNHLLESRARPQEGPRAWASKALDDTGGRQVRSGFAHGASGIVYALLRLFARTGDAELRLAALEAAERERQMLRPSLGGWLPSWGGRAPVSMLNAWCCGAHGIAIARAAALETVDDLPGFVEDLRIALELAQTEKSHHHGDHLCCGDLGRVMILLEAHRALTRRPAGVPTEPIRRAADRLLLFVLRRAKTRRTFHWPSPEHRYSFMHGIKGGIYLFLYALYPGRLPVPLLIEPPCRRETASDSASRGLRSNETPNSM